ncbi:MAG: N-acetylmuramoyl-L-alanine amidase [Luteolibacter sp.]
MSRFSARQLLLTITLILLTVAAVFIFRKPLPKPPPPVTKPTAAQPPATHSVLAEPPDWSALDAFQNTISREEFERLLTTVFTTGQAWKNFIEIGETEASIKTGELPPADVFHLHFATSASIKAPSLWKTAADLPPTTQEKPLADLKIAIDPGHIGGAWAKMEERWFVVGDGNPVCEGDMTLHVAEILKPKLEALGATVSLVRDKAEPVTTVRPEALLSIANETKSPASPESPQKLAERLFYRTAEIHARAKLVNESLKPDLVLCLHFNAEAWGDPNKPTLIDHTHLHLLVNGAYSDDEVSLADQRFALLHKLLQRTHPEEIEIGSSIASSFAEATGLPPYQYPPDSLNVRQIPNQPYLWARNLLANRLYHCPTIFMEPYVMNSTIDYARIQAGDYSGLREIGGKKVPSIFREYADAATAGLANHYRALRRTR